MPKQLRICRGERIRDINRDLVTHSDWVDASEATEAECQALVDAGNGIFGAGSHWIESRDVTAAYLQPDRHIHELIDQSMQCWIEGDMVRHLSYFTPGAILITPIGSYHLGHAGLRAAFSSQRTSMPGLRMTVDERQITYPGQDTAIVLMAGNLQHSNMSLRERWASTQVVVRGPDDRWLIASLHVFHVRDADSLRDSSSVVIGAANAGDEVSG